MKAKRILIIDDDRTSVAATQGALIKEGFEVIYAYDGMQGLDLINQYDVDLIILDIVMPVMDGVDFFKEMKKSIRTSGIPVIVITESKVVEDSFRVLGVNDFLSKPLEVSTILFKVERALTLKGSRFSLDKILVTGSNRAAITEMEEILKDKNYTVWLTEDSADIISKALVMVPTLAIIDTMQKDISSDQIIKALRSFSKLARMKIAIYNCFKPEMVGDQVLVSQLFEAKDKCLSCGADGYIGTYNKFSFMDEIEKFLAQGVISSQKSDNSDPFSPKG
ncbi:MAG: response regulator [Candidatus Omnitrophica bacterium]|nr:response regulator [Candidatus Omnitrophota bacterium]